MIYSFQPFARNKKDFGKVYNAHCEGVANDKDWILLMDTDAMMLTPEKTYAVIEEAIFRYPDTTIFGAMCNRVALQYQTLLDYPDDNGNIEDHILKSEELADLYADGECFEVKTIAGFFMLFRKEYWKEVKFQEHIYMQKGGGWKMFDAEFCKPAFESGRKIRVIKGAYLWHTYRIMQEDWRKKDHLIIKE